MAGNGAELPLGTPNSALGKALGYTTRQWPKLVRHLDHPEMPVDNNYIERQIKSFCAKYPYGVNRCPCRDQTPAPFLAPPLVSCNEDAEMLTPGVLWGNASLPIPLALICNPNTEFCMMVP